MMVTKLLPPPFPLFSLPIASRRFPSRDEMFGERRKKTSPPSPNLRMLDVAEQKTRGKKEGGRGLFFPLFCPLFNY